MSLRVFYAVGLVALFAMLIMAVVLSAISLALYAAILFVIVQIDPGLTGQHHIVPLLIWILTVALILIPVYKGGENLIPESSWHRAGCFAHMSAVMVVFPIYLHTCQFMVNALHPWLFPGFDLKPLKTSAIWFYFMWTGPLWNILLPLLFDKLEALYQKGISRKT